MKNTAVIYTRVSSGRQVDNMSLGEQRRICEDYCTRNDWSIDKVFIELGESAKTADRSQLQEMLTYCRTNKSRIGHLVVYKLDRFARSMNDHTSLRLLLKKMDIILWSATEPISESTTGTLMENVLASFAQFDNDVRSERSRGGMVARALEGCWVAKPPIGYVNVHDELKRPTLAYSDEESVKAIQKFYKEFETGRYSQTESIKLAETCGIRSPSGHPLSKNGAGRILRNIVYAGFVQNGLTGNKRVPGLHPAMISIEMFMSVQSILQGKTRKLYPVKRAKPDYPLKKFLRCGKCNHALTGSAPKGRQKHYAAYNCPKCKKKTHGYSIRIPKDKAHAEFSALLDQLTPSDWALKAFKEVVIRRWNKDFRDLQDERRNIDKEIAKLEDHKNELFDRWMSGRIKDDKMYDEQNTRITLRREALEMDRSALKSDEVNKEQVVDHAVHFMAHASEIWSTARVADKVRFQNLVYEAGIVLNINQTFGTTDPSPIYVHITAMEKVLEANKKDLSGEKSLMVTPRRVELLLPG